jgi:nucleoside-diphosphate-sugar epimerase
MEANGSQVLLNLVKWTKFRILYGKQWLQDVRKNNTMFSLKNKTAIISGGSKGIGKAIALKYSEAGANVIICSRKKENLDTAVQEAKSNGFDIIAIECNTGDVDSIQNVVNQTVDKFGKVDILVNNAAANPYYGPILKAEDSHWDKIFQINVKGYFEFAKACSASMIENKSGKIINVGTGVGVSIQELIKKICAHLEKDFNKITIIEDDSTTGESIYNVADITLLKEFGVTPSISIDKGLKLFINSRYNI